MTSEDYNIDRAFFHCLKEIEISYTVLPKILRLRIEKWVEKFITVGHNTVWKKNRNMYAKLLLSMIISKSLTDPFHVSPVEGQPLPPFPSYLIPKFKSALGPHESYFWRNIFDRVHEPPYQTPPPPPTPQASSELPPAPSPSYVKLDPSQKETYNLRLLMKEQSRRIELLEEQMQQERLKHQMELQNVLQNTQEETNRIKHLYRSSGGVSGYSDRNESILTSNPYEIYDGNTTYGKKRFPSRTKNKSPGKNGWHSPSAASGSNIRHDSRGSKINSSYLPQELSSRPPPAVPFPQASNDSFIPNSKYQHSPHASSRYAESKYEQNPASDYSIGIPVFTPGKEEYKDDLMKQSPSHKTPLKSASKNVNFQENRYDIKPLSYDPDRSRKQESRDIAPPLRQHKGDIAPDMNFPTNQPYSPVEGHGLSYANDHNKRSPVASSPFVKDKIWPDYQNEDFSTKGDTTYDIARSTVNRPDSNVPPVLTREVPEDEGEFMSYLEDFQSEIRSLQFNTTHNKGL